MCIGRRPLPLGFAGPATSFVECRPANATEELAAHGPLPNLGGSGAGFVRQPRVANVVYGDTPIADGQNLSVLLGSSLASGASGAAVVCAASSAPHFVDRGGNITATLVMFVGGAGSLSRNVNESADARAANASGVNASNPAARSACSGAPTFAFIADGVSCQKAPPGAPKRFAKVLLQCVSASASANVSLTVCEDQRCEQGCEAWVVPGFEQPAAYNTCYDGWLALCPGALPPATHAAARPARSHVSC